MGTKYCHMFYIHIYGIYHNFCLARLLPSFDEYHIEV